jgi:hypothetical protein
LSFVIFITLIWVSLFMVPNTTTPGLDDHLSTGGDEGMAPAAHDSTGADNGTRDETEGM